MQPSFDMDALRTMVIGVELGSFARAAVQLGRSQSAVSMQLKKLEQQAGRPLFRRDGRGLVPTEAGDALLAYARRIIALNDEAALSMGATVEAPAVRLGAAESAKFGGVYRDAHTDHVIALAAGDTALAATGATAFVPVGAMRFRTGTSTAEFLSTGATKRFVVVNAGGDSSWYDAVKPAPATVPTADYVGRYVSDELDVELDVVARDGKLFVNRRPDDSIELRPTYADGFQGAGLGSVRFARDARGAIEGFSIYAGRVLDVRFKRAR